LPNRRRTAPAFAALAMARRSEFEGRMMAILEDEARRDPLSAPGIAGGSVAAAVLAVALAGFSPLAAHGGGARVAAAPGAPAAAAPGVPTPISPGETGDLRAPEPAGGRPAAARVQGRSEQGDSVPTSRREDDNWTAVLAQNAASGDDALLAFAMRAVPALPRDRQKSIVLAHAARGALRGDARLRDAFFAAFRSITSDEDRTIVVVHAMANGQGSPAVTERVLRAAAGMRSPEAASAVLMNVAQRRLVTSDALRALYVDAADAIASEVHRQHALTALLQATPTHP
jgi:hypothetical protein